MSFAMQPVQFPHGGWPEGNDRAPGSDQTYPRGTPVTFATGSQELDECSTDDTTDILGVTLEGCSSGTADNPSGTVCYASARHPNLFVAKLINGSGTVQTVDTANIAVQYAIRQVSSGADQWWGIDENDSSNVAVEVVDIDVDRNVVIFQFIDSAVQVGV